MALGVVFANLHVLIMQVWVLPLLESDPGLRGSWFTRARQKRPLPSNLAAWQQDDEGSMDVILQAGSLGARGSEAAKAKANLQLFL